MSQIISAESFLNLQYLAPQRSPQHESCLQPHTNIYTQLNISETILHTETKLGKGTSMG